MRRHSGVGLVWLVLCNAVLLAACICIFTLIDEDIKGQAMMKTKQQPMLCRSQPFGYALDPCSPRSCLEKKSC